MNRTPYAYFLTRAAAVAGVALALPTLAQSTSPGQPAEPAKSAQPDPKPADPKDKAEPGAKADAKPKEEAKPVSPYVLNFKVKTLEGKEQDLSAYKGKVVLIVNVASKCGYTPQYEGLEKLYEAKKDAGLVILGFPANNFGGQEPGTASEIRSFCDSKYHVSFPMFEKISVVSEATAADAKAKNRPISGGDQHPLYQLLSAQPAPIGGDPKWNFTKFVVDHNGNVVARYDADKKLAQKPDLEPALLEKVDELLKQK
jgi:glutathione peroxidase